MIERRRRQNDPDVPPVYGRKVRVSAQFVDIFEAWLDLQIARREGSLLTAEMKVVSRMQPVSIEGWPQFFWYVKHGPVKNPWGGDVFEFTIYSPEFDSEIEDWRPLFTNRDGMK